MKSKPKASPPRRKRRIGLYLAMLAVSVVVALGLAEIALRLFPIPGIIFHNYYYDDVTGGKYYPKSSLMYRGDDGVLIRRRVNSWGFPDVEHAMEASPGTLRIGFFGDSYVESLQVPIEQTFFRLIENDLDLRAGELAKFRTHAGLPINGVEPIAFGISGRGALQSYLESRRWMETLDLDYVVYVFVENDPADQIRELKGPGTLPYPVLAGDSFTIDNSSLEAAAYKSSWWHRSMQRVKSNSLVVSTIEGRLKLRGDAGDAPMATPAWTPDLVKQGWELQERVMDKWRAEAEAQGRKFIVMHVPRGNEVLRTMVGNQDTWTLRLHMYCMARGVPLIEPTPLFVARMDAGETMYHNHFTPEGHRAFAQAFVDYLVKSAASP